ncbi:27109_t:CDS:2, partial [Dentiscutata erythropus]
VRPQQGILKLLQDSLQQATKLFTLHPSDNSWPSGMKTVFAMLRI